MSEGIERQIKAIMMGKNGEKYGAQKQYVKMWREEGGGTVG